MDPPHHILEGPTGRNRIVQYFLNYRPIRPEDCGEGAGMGGVYPNLFSSCPPMQIDANFGFTAGIAEMLLQSHQDRILLLPALPKAWPAGEVRGLCARGGFEVDIRWDAGRLVEATLQSNLGKPCLLRYGDKQIDFATERGKTYKYDGDLKKRQ